MAGVEASDKPPLSLPGCSQGQAYALTADHGLGGGEGVVSKVGYPQSLQKEGS